MRFLWEQLKLLSPKKMFYATEPKEHNLEAVGQRHKSGFSGQEKKLKNFILEKDSHHRYD